MAELYINYKESWIFIEGNKTKYKITTNGDVLNSETGKVMKGGRDKNGYHIVSLTYKKRKYTRKVHRLVAEAFIINPYELPEVNHKNGEKACNYVWNLEWVEPHENKHHAQAMGLCPQLLTGDKVHSICRDLEKGKLKVSKIAKKYKISYATVAKILNRNQWKSVSQYYDFSKYDRTKTVYKGSKNGNAVLTEKIVKEICKGIRDGSTPTDIANALGIKRYLVYKIRRKEVWKHISDKYF